MPGAIHEAARAGRLERFGQLADAERTDVRRNRDQLVRLQELDDLLLARLVRRQEFRLILRHALRARRIGRCEARILQHRLERAIAAELDLAEHRDVTRIERQQQHTASAGSCRSPRPSASSPACCREPGVEPVGVCHAAPRARIARLDEALAFARRQPVRKRHETRGVEIVAAARGLDRELRVQLHRLASDSCARSRSIAGIFSSRAVAARARVRCGA